MLRSVLLAAICLGVLGASVGCTQSIPKEALALSPQSLEYRQLQTRRFDTEDEKRLLSASAGLLQDLGFNIDESETQLGVIVASKDRDATESGQVAGAVIIAILFGVVPAIDKEQKIRASVVTREHEVGGERKGTSLRVTFQRVVWNDRGQISKVEKLAEPGMYEEFFKLLSKAVFLEAQSI